MVICRERAIAALTVIVAQCDKAIAAYGRRRAWAADRLMALRVEAYVEDVEQQRQAAARRAYRRDLVEERMARRPACAGVES